MSVRWPILLSTSFISFSADYFYDVPSVVHDRLTFNASACLEGRDKCLHLTAVQYDLLFAVYAWFGACIVPFSGIIADKLGCRWTLTSFGILFFLGSAIFSSSVYFDNEQTSFILMMCGRMIFGVGSTSASVVTSRLLSLWFKDKELGLAFAINIVAGRLGSVVNFLLTENVAEAIGLRPTLWLGTALCGVGLVGGVVAGYIHSIGLRRLGREASEESTEPFRIGMIKQFTPSFWVLALFLVFFYAGVLPFVAEAPHYFEDRFHYTPSYAGYIAGSTYDIALISPLFGFLSDRWGRRGLWVLAAPTILLSGYILLVTIPWFPPILFCLMMGVAYTLVAAIAWSCAPLLVPESGVGTAMGLLSSFQMFGVGVSNALIGVLLNQSNKSRMEVWDDVVWLLGSCAGVGFLMAIMLNISDYKTGYRLRASQKERALQSKEVQTSSTETGSYKEYLIDPTESLGYGSNENSSAVFPEQRVVFF
ncbi:hypothetical protein RvY_13073 [Ramazzottius varieornatus]|uniref:Lysosomal dipeptide transporter MFSD1 n=1 Tax=Ramazzottius varieornatus TaxID=947166 RepID=A0A1D1VLP6_RAMVA|nr:hypothetical protein RvY_13073 [Ramazzottius varieornatus]